MDRLLDHEMEELNHLLLAMGGEVEKQLDMAIDALVHRDSDLAQQVIDGDAVIDRRELEVDQRVMAVVIREKPMARDLRLVLSAVKIAPDLERVADHAVNVARQAIELSRVPPLKKFVILPRMAEVARSMVRDALGAFVKRDPELARQVIGRDEEVDAYYEQLFRELLTYMMEDPTTIPRCLALLLVAASLERIADQGTNIAEQAVYVIEGQDIRHRHAREGAE
ncbi:MAG TPA: phosphate signaling complex protein PhoU [Thermoanaerobaculaceae bacterium]|nr:phosphate signaling complex protein PhoU [Thermoanaerobaculaceae bacterium]HPS77793.1 phosphate signaling complex protein PhoU [Thermoanaerobaculaceae bacterium]